MFCCIMFYYITTDAACCYRRSSMVYQTVCVCVCLSVGHVLTFGSPAKKAEPIEMRIGG